MMCAKRARQYRQRVYELVRPFVYLLVCGWLALVPPGLSYYWLINPQRHAKIDAERYDQLPDGRMLSGHPYQPPHEHPSSGGLPTIPSVQLDNKVVLYSQAIFWEANRPSLQNSYSEAAAIASAVFLDLPEHPPRA